MQHSNAIRARLQSDGANRPASRLLSCDHHTGQEFLVGVRYSYQP